ncbi:MAG: putative choline transporter, neither null mutation nor overexpression affects choline transport [Vezdaea aestivalis]|nr:MAG: putative choline transporter, neither null mutation nor overexpression affects choline transport [Vezdaea aestivalis]
MAVTQQAHGGASDSYFTSNEASAPPATDKARYTQSNGDAPPSYDQVFELEKPKYNDLWAAILFVVVFLGFVAVSAISIQGYAATKGSNGGGIYDGRTTFGLTTNTVILFAFVLAVAFTFSLLYLVMVRFLTKQIIWITGILQIVFGIGTAIFYFVRHYYSAAVVFMIFSVFYIICFISWIPRIPFSVFMLRTAIDVSRNFGHVFLVSALGGLAATAFGAWYSVTLVSIYVKYSPGNNPACSQGAGRCSSGKVIGLLVFVTFAAFWASEVLKNVIHVSISGVYGSWYFCSRNFPKGATRGAAKRALTTSFGSVAFGSLVVSLIQMLKQIVSIAQRQEAATGSTLGACCFCVLGCLISLIEWAISFLNEYAFSFIALYGKPYIAAAKDTWRMMKDRGFDVLINECLVNPVLTMAAVFIGYLCALLAYLYLIFTKPAYNSTGSFTPVVLAFSFLIGLQITNIFLVPIKSGIATIFVAASFNPEILGRDHPELYAKMIAVYPAVQTAVGV